MHSYLVRPVARNYGGGAFKGSVDLLIWNYSANHSLGAYILWCVQAHIHKATLCIQNT